VIVLAAIFMMLALGRVILYLTDGTKVVWDSVQVLGLLSWVLGGLLAAEVLGWLPSITFG
jgi:hypothetical protein